MKTIWKFELAVTDKQFLVTPSGSGILSVGNQDEKICLWMLVDPSASPKETRIVRIYGTGRPCDQESENDFVGTVLMDDGLLVWHVFISRAKVDP